MELEIHCRFDALVPAEELIPHPKNRNIHPPDQIERLAKLLKYQGIRAPIVVDKRDKKTIVKGHGTLEAIKLTGEKSIPVVYQSFKDDDQAYAFVQSDNAIGAWASLDFRGINLDLGDLGPDFDLDLLGLRNFELEPLDKYGDKDADAMPEIRSTNIELGDLYSLGIHRLLCGDSTDSKSVERLMNGEKADMVFTDPPYGIDVAGHDGKIGQGKKAISKTYGDIIGDTKEFDPRFLLDLPGEKFIFGGNYFAHILPRSTHWIVWNKHSKDEHSRANDFSDCELIWTTINRTSTVQYVHGWSGMFRNGPKKEEYNKVHPAQKPVGLISEILNDYPANLILDPFLGSGSTLIACEKTNRKCRGAEIDPMYCDVIVRRWMKFTGQMAYLIGDASSELKSGPVPFVELDSLRSTTPTKESKSHYEFDGTTVDVRDRWGKVHGTESC